MKNNKLLGVGAGGSIFFGICCFTPLLVILLGGFGLSAWLGWLDFVLLPGLAIFLTLTAYALIRRFRSGGATGNTGT